MRKGLHDVQTQQMQSQLQGEIDALAATGSYTGILLGYARCNDGVAGLEAPGIPLVLPRAHDCITFFFGSRQAYQQYFDTHPGTYFHSSGWLERGDGANPDDDNIMQRMGFNDDYEQLVAKYGKDNADYIRQSLGDTRSNYKRLCYLQMNVADEQELISRSREQARDNGWEFELRQGNLSLLQKLLWGPWDQDVLVVPPGKRIVARNDQRVVDIEQ
jgi:hypothetical protein